MDPTAILNTQFVQVALPIMITLALGSWLNNKRIDDLGKRIDDLKADVNRRFDHLELMVSDHGQRIVRLKERTSPLASH